MDVQKYSDFILNEARKNKDEAVSSLLDMLKKKPHVEMKTCSNEKGIYSISGMKTYLSGKFTSAEVDGALHNIMNDKSVDLNHIRVKVAVWNETIPYYYMDMTLEEAKKIKGEYEEQEYEKNKEELNKKSTQRKTAAAKSAAEEEKKAERKATKKPAAKKASGTGVARKAGAPKRKVTTRTRVKK